MKMTIRFKIYPTKEQEDVSWILSEKCRLLYNFALEHRNDVYKKTGASVTYDMQQDDLHQIKKKYPEYEWVYSKVLQMVLKVLDADFKSYKKLKNNAKTKGTGDKNAQPPGFKGKNYFTTMTWNQSGFKIENGKVILSHYYKDDKKNKKNYVPLEFDIPEDLMKNTDVDLETIYGFGKIKQITLFREDPNIKNESDYYLSVVYEYPIEFRGDNHLYQAIDLGINKTVTAVNMEAKFFEIKNPRVDKYWNPIIDNIQSKRDHCKKVEEKVKGIIDIESKGKDGKKIIVEKDIEKKIVEPSNRWVKLNDIKKKCHTKAQNQIKDDQHKWSDIMTNNSRSNTFIVGDLNVKNMAQSGIKINVKNDNKNNDDNNQSSKSETKTIKVKSHTLNRSTQNQGYLSRFVRFLTYKAEKIGKRIIEIDEKFTSKRCYSCGKIHDMPLWERTMKCDCGNIIDRDRNSAINIMINFLSQNDLWTAYQKFVNSLKKEGLSVPTWVKIPISF